MFGQADLLHAKIRLPEWTFFGLYNPTNPFTNLKPHNQEIGEFSVVQGRRTTDFEAPYLRKCRSG